jgi:DNA uptake protein ComE-like DNA-binding protein
MSLGKMGLGKWLGGSQAQLLNNPYSRIQPEEIPIAIKLGITIDVNQAGVDDWLRLPGLSIHQARSLVALSQSGVAFHCLEDIAAALSMPLQRLRPIAPLLQFCYYDDDEVARLHPLNPNTASLEQLTQIPAVDLYLARAIVQNRQQGAYRSLADLQRRLALPGPLTSEIMHFLRF